MERSRSARTPTPSLGNRFLMDCFKGVWGDLADHPTTNESKVKSNISIWIRF